MEQVVIRWVRQAYLQLKVLNWVPIGFTQVSTYLSTLFLSQPTQKIDINSPIFLGIYALKNRMLFQSEILSSTAKYRWIDSVAKTTGLCCYVVSNCCSFPSNILFSFWFANSLALDLYH